jgi:hypothetical protein
LAKFVNIVIGRQAVWRADYDRFWKILVDFWKIRGRIASPLEQVLARAPRACSKEGDHAPPLKKRGKLANSFFFEALVLSSPRLAQKTEFATCGKLGGKLAKSFWQSASEMQP